MFHVEISQSRGTPYEIGLQQGEKVLLTAQEQKLLSTPWPTTTHEFSISSAQKAFNKYAPNIWEEFVGLADGMKQPVEVIVRQWGNYTLQYPRTGCSAIVVDGMYARNYDFQARYYEPRFALSQSKGVYASAGFSHFLVGRVDGMNEKGLVCGLHLVSFRRPGPGFIATIIVRMVLDQCESVDEAVDLLMRLPHGLSYNYSLLDAKGNGAVVEATPKTVGVRRGRSLACTNHFQSQLLRPVNPKNTQHSRIRLPPLEAQFQAAARVKGIFIDQEAKELFGFLNASSSPAFHHGYVKGAGTLHTVVCIPELRRMLVGIGGDTSPTNFDLSEWVSGTNFRSGVITGQLGGVTKPFHPGRRLSNANAGRKSQGSIKKVAKSFGGHDLRGTRLSGAIMSGCLIENSDLSSVSISESCKIEAMKIYGVTIEDLFGALEELRQTNPNWTPKKKNSI